MKKPVKPRKPSLSKKPSLKAPEEFIQHDEYSIYLDSKYYNLDKLVRESGFKKVKLNEIELRYEAGWEDSELLFIIKRAYKEKLKDEVLQYQQERYKKELSDYPNKLKKWEQRKSVYKERLAKYKLSLSKYYIELEKYNEYMEAKEKAERRAKFEQLKKEFEK